MSIRREGQFREGYGHMDTELRKGVQILERGIELADKESMHGDRKGGILQAAGEAADLDIEIEALRRKVFSARVQAMVLVLLTGAVLIARLLF